MKRKIVHIDEELCDGCGLCVPSCHEGAIQIINGKAKLVSEVYCDGLGACLGHCPQGAISIEEREAEAFNEQAVETHLAQQKHIQAIMQEAKSSCSSGCPGSQVKSFNKPKAVAARNPGTTSQPRPSQLRQWPVQLHLVPPQAPFLEGTPLLIAADCAPFAMADFHESLLKDKALLIACPKLDDTQAYLDKLTAIFSMNDIPGITIAIMEVPCCRGLVMLVKQALALAGKTIPVEIATVSIQGELISKTAVDVNAA